MTFSGRELRSIINPDGKLTLSLEEVVIDEPGDDEIIVRVEAAQRLGGTDVRTALERIRPGELEVRGDAG